ncbi:MAG: transcriptional repressor LexA [Sphaerochaetaceae bacterium]|nr:transcriptional repressor LexA [Sphaerochaetaceae bacterium]MDD3941584.1 transcriptional repressor LexA [Sphaerochaetaceae bacterium]MDX9939084.1 transcriptional repressor LexA [Sphaerochaetaceae bacterium]
MKGLTGRQQEVLDFIKSYIESNSYAPAVRDIAKAFGITVKAAHDHLKALERKGAIHSSEGISRSTGVVGFTASAKVETISIPVLGSTAAGMPILAEENKEYDLQVPASLIPGKGPYFALHIEGDSMIEAGILDGDLAIIRQANNAHNGEIVVARVGEENRVTLKRFYVNANSIELRPENPKYGSLFSKDVTVLGKLQMIIRDYEH